MTDKEIIKTSKFLSLIFGTNRSGRDCSSAKRVGWAWTNCCKR